MTSDWLAALGAELRAASHAVLMVDRSADAKHVLVGAQVQEWVRSHVTTLLAAAKSCVVLAPLLGRHGQIEALVRVLRWDDDAVMLMASPDQETRLDEWLRCAQLPTGIRNTDVTASHAVLELSGLRRAALLKAVGFKAGPASTCWIGAVPVSVLEDVLNDSTLLITPSDCAVHLWQHLLGVGKTFGLRIGGHFAQEAIRIQRGVPGFGREATPNRLVGELGARMLASGARGSSTRDPPRTHRKRILAAFSSPLPMLGMGSQEVILQNGLAVGELTSRVRLAGWTETLALGLLEPGSLDGTAIETVAGGRRWPLTPRDTVWNKCR